MPSKIDKIVNRILNRYFEEYSSRNKIVIEDIISQNGVNISYNYYIPEDIPGAYTVTTKNNITIEKNNVTYNLYYIRKRFALAHAFGHIVLGHDFSGKKIDIISNYSYSVESKEEREANEFARKILVPKDMFEVAVLKSPSFETICDYFGVSEVLMKIRIQEITGL